MIAFTMNYLKLSAIRQWT